MAIRKVGSCLCVTYILSSIGPVGDDREEVLVCRRVHFSSQSLPDSTPAVVDTSSHGVGEIKNKLSLVTVCMNEYYCLKVQLVTQ